MPRHLKCRAVHAVMARVRTAAGPGQRRQVGMPHASGQCHPTVLAAARAGRESESPESARPAGLGPYRDRDPLSSPGGRPWSGSLGGLGPAAKRACPARSPSPSEARAQHCGNLNIVQVQVCQRTKQNLECLPLLIT
jgi:hypothetical protein